LAIIHFNLKSCSPHHNQKIDTVLEWKSSGGETIGERSTFEALDMILWLVMSGTTTTTPSLERMKQVLKR